ncbi:MAG: pyridoxamine 5'-phosphate oxidase family protein [Candidatus Saccharimonadales bacterium]
MSSKQSQNGTVEAKRIHQFLASQKFGSLGTVNADGDPCVTVVFYTIDDQFNITFKTKSQTKLCKNLNHNDHVMFLVYDVPSQTTTQIAGTIQRVNVEDQTNPKPESSGFQTPISKLKAGELVSCKLQPASINMKVYSGDEAETLNLSFD